MRLSLLALSFLLAVACSSSESAGPAKAKGPAAETIGPGGIRHVPIEAGENGYVPARITGKPGENLVLVFTRTIDGECLSKVKIDGGEAKELPKGTPVSIPITVPETGQLQFACGMDMFTGIVVAN